MYCCIAYTVWYYLEGVNSLHSKLPIFRVKLIKNLHRAIFFYTDTVCGICDKYEVWVQGESIMTENILIEHLWHAVQPVYSDYTPESGTKYDSLYSYLPSAYGQSLWHHSFHHAWWAPVSEHQDEIQTPNSCCTFISVLLQAWQAWNFSRYVTSWKPRTKKKLRDSAYALYWRQAE